MKMNNLVLIATLISASLAIASESEKNRTERLAKEQAEQTIRDTRARADMMHAQATGQQVSASAQMQMNYMDRAAAWLQNQNTPGKR